MRLVKCHIENFGKLHDLTLDFQEGMNILSYENGWGKSTLATFLRVMLYGFQGETKRSSQENERKRYEPWQGGVYGGSLTIEANGKTYVINRVFKDKVANDLFELREAHTNLESRDFTSNIGEELFQINGEAFLRTSFIGQQDCVTNTTDSINAKIGNLTDNTNDLNSYEVADEALKDILNKMNPRVKKGSIHQLQEEITRLKQEVSDGNALERSMETLQNYYEDALTKLELVKEKKTIIGAEQEKVSRYQDILAKKDTYDLLCKEAEEKEAHLKEKATKFTNGVPSEQEVKNALEQCAQMEQWAGEEKYSHLTEEEKKEYEVLSQAFSQGMPSIEALQRAKELAQKVEAEQKNRAEFKMTREEEEKYLAEKEFFQCENPSGEINRLQQKWNERETIKSTLSVQQASLEMMKHQQLAQEITGKKSASQRLAIAIIVIVCGVAAIGIGVYISRGLVMAIGVCGLIVGAVLLLLHGKKPHNRKIETGCNDFPLEKEISGNERRAEEIRVLVQEYFEGHDISYQEDDVSMRLQELLNRALIYENLSDKYRKYNELLAINSEEERICEIEKLFEPYGVLLGSNSGLSEKAQRLMQCHQRFFATKEKRERNNVAKDNYGKARYSVVSFLQQLGIEPLEEALLRNQLQHLLEEVTVYKTLVESSKQATKKKEDYEQQYNINEFFSACQSEDLKTLQELQEQYTNLEEEAEQIRASIKTYEEQLNGLQEQYDEWVATKELLEEKEVECSRRKQQYMLLGKTREFLGKAKASLTARYTGPIMEHFARYYSMVNGDGAGSYHMDANIHVTKEEQGLQRDVAFLSAGYQDLIGVCLRLALVEAMYSGEKPMLVMDDPFVNLDEIRTKGSKRLLSELSKDYQIIYFTCK